METSTGISAVRTAFIWIAFAVAYGLLAGISVVFIRVYTKKQERDAFVTITSIFSLAAVLATALLLPVDIAVVNATAGAMQDLTGSETAVKIVYYILYSVDAFLILILIPFAYFWYEEWDGGESSVGERIRGALKFAVIFLGVAVALLIVGLFIPYGRGVANSTYDFVYFRQLLDENRGERGLTFVIGVLLCLGIIIFVIYTAVGFAVLPILMIKWQPEVSGTVLNDTRVALELNREKQRMIEAKYEGSSVQWNIRDKRAYESLQREEKTLIRMVRLNGGGVPRWWRPKWLKTAWNRAARPVVVVAGVLLLAIALLVIASMVVTMVDKIMHTTCGRHCGFLLMKTQILNPINEILILASRGFPADYIITFLIVVWMFVSTIIGMSYLSIRIAWIVLFRIQRRKTYPQGLLLASALLMVAVLAINYTFTTIIAPDYSRYGNQRFCFTTVDGLYGVAGACDPGQLVTCAEASAALLLQPAYQTPVVEDPAAGYANATAYFYQACRQTAVTTFLDRVVVNFPWFGLWSFWAQFGFFGVFLLALIVAIVRRPSFNSYDADDDDDDEEQQSLLGRTSARLSSTWDDLAARGRRAAFTAALRGAAGSAGFD
ncbi:uncharacterized protein V1510DRAFT_409983 [Dipodascopsis tothii]|uniref:uncharacterized protein n=1 Tax=Dipodascopsis tothii TaxID=44089 RepID=UPI0034CDC4FC